MAYLCSIEHCMQQLGHLAAAKRPSIRMGREEFAEMCHSYADKMAQRFDADTVSHACNAWAVGRRGWPDIYDLLDLCAKLHNEQKSGSRNPVSKTGFYDRLLAEGFEIDVLKGTAYDHWCPLFEIYRSISSDQFVDTVRKLSSGGWKLSARGGQYVLVRVGEDNASDRQKVMAA